MTRTLSRPEAESISPADLPEGWVMARLADITDQVANIKPELRPSQRFCYVDIGSIDNRTNRIAETKQFHGAEAPSRARRPVQAGDVLFSNVRTYLRNIALITNDVPADLCSTGFTVLRANAATLPAYLFYSVVSDAFIDAVSETQTGTHYPATNDDQVRGSTIPLPPLAEQKRIVEAIERLTARVDAARERLANVPAILKRSAKPSSLPPAPAISPQIGGMPTLQSGRLLNLSLSSTHRLHSTDREARLAKEAMSSTWKRCPNCPRHGYIVEPTPLSPTEPSSLTGSFCPALRFQTVCHMCGNRTFKTAGSSLMSFVVQLLK